MNIHQITYLNKQYFCAYKVVKEDMTSLGLRKNPNIMTFSLNDWIYLPEKDIVMGNSDFGGIWLARTKGRAKAYQKYMKENYNSETKVFLSLIDKILFVNQDRVKTNGLKMIEEIFL